MGYLKTKNNAKSTLNGAINGVVTSLIVTSASTFPSSGSFLVTIWNKTTFPDPSDDPNMEIVKVTTVSTNTFTIVRAQDGTSAHSHSNGDNIELLFVKGIVDDTQTLCKNNFLKVKFGDGNGGESNFSAASFNLVNFHTLNSYSVVSDINSNWTGAPSSLAYGDYYTCPMDGLYRVFITLRNVDSSSDQDLGIGAGIDINNGAGYDSPDFKWQRVPAGRATHEHTVYLTCTAGNRIIMFTYSDSGALDCSDGSMSIELLYPT